MRPGLQSRKSHSTMPTESLGFDVTARADFTLVVPILATPPRFTIYQVPPGLAYADVHWLTVVGDPDSLFINNVTWILTVTRAGPQEVFMQSIREGSALVIDMSGFRWGIMGSLTEPFPVAIRVNQGEMLGVSILSHTALNFTPLTIYARAAGKVFQ